MDLLRYDVTYYSKNNYVHIYRKIAKTSRTYIKMSLIKIRVIFEILLNSIVCFLQFSSSYIQIRVIIKVEVFPRLYGSCTQCMLQKHILIYSNQYIFLQPILSATTLKSIFHFRICIPTLDIRHIHMSDGSDMIS